MGIPFLTSRRVARRVPWRVPRRVPPRITTILMIPLCLFWLAGCAGQESEPESADAGSDQAQVIADEVMEAMGG